MHLNNAPLKFTAKYQTGNSNSTAYVYRLSYIKKHDIKLMLQEKGGGMWRIFQYTYVVVRLTYVELCMQ